MTRPEDLARLREALSAPELTRGDWQVSGTRARHLELGRDAQLHMVGPDADPVAAVFYDTRTGRGYADARYIAACSPAVIAALVAERDGLLARIDALMLEYCPDEMTAKQKAEWARHQVVLDDSAEIDAALTQHTKDDDGK